MAGIDGGGGEGKLGVNGWSFGCDNGKGETPFLCRGRTVTDVGIRRASGRGEMQYGRRKRIAALTTWSKAGLRAGLVAWCLLAGCSQDPHSLPNYDDPALVVKGSEIFRPVKWGEVSRFGALDANGDNELELEEFRAEMLRDGIRQRAAKIFGLLDSDSNNRLTAQEFLQTPGIATVTSLDEDGNGVLSAAEVAGNWPILKENGRLGAFFTILDRDGDKQLSAAEVETRPFVTPFFERDRDGDGQVSPTEFAEGRESPTQPESGATGFRSHDLDGDGNLTMSEFLYRPEDGKFWAMDQDGDGIVNSREFAASRYAKGLDNSAAALATMDDNSDGRLTIDEYRRRDEDMAETFGSPIPFWRGNAAKEFARIDRNNDGELVPGELYEDDSSRGLAERFRYEFDTIDANRDGRVDPGEFSNLGQRFEFVLVDVNRDGLVSSGEYLEAEPPWFTRKRIGDMFSAADLDGDGTLTITEFNARAAATEFLRCDVDEDERLSLVEFAQGRPMLAASGQVAKAFECHDIDGDKTLTRDEFRREPWLVRFLMLDRNGDGALDGTEFTSDAKNEAAAESRQKNFAVRDGDRNGRLSLREFFWQPEMAAFWAMDADQDDSVSLEELQEAGRLAQMGPMAATIFKTLDRNHNGQYELAEYATRSCGMILVELDQDHDSHLSLEEFSAFGFASIGIARRNFGLADLDADGRLTQEEFKTRLTVPPVLEEQDEEGTLAQIAFLGLDTDGDGRLTLPELSRRSRLKDFVASAHAAVDTDHDGVVVFSEFKAGQQRMEFLAWDRDGNGLLSLREFHVGAVPWVSPRRSKAVFSALDRDGDSSINLEESAGTRGLKQFLDYDRDEDAIVTLDEFGKTRYPSAGEGQLAGLFAAYDLDGDKKIVPAEMRESPVTEAFLAKDSNGDRRLALAEFLNDPSGARGIAERVGEFKRLDTDADEFITLREFFFSPLTAKFWAMDADKDMVVDQKEFAAAKCTQCFGDRQAAFSALDRNSNELLDIDEFLRRNQDVSVAFGLKTSSRDGDADGLFGELDGNDDGKLSPTEFHRGKLPWATDSYAATVFAALDANNDQELSPHEFDNCRKTCGLLLSDWDEDGVICFAEFARASGEGTAAARAAFRKRDADADGMLSPAEYRQTDD